MLVLTRKIQEKINIGGNVTITILRVKGRSVRVGIEAPRDVRVVRSELPEEPASENSAASATGDESSMDGNGNKEATSAAGDDREPMVVGGRYRVIAPADGKSMLCAIPIASRQPW